VKYARPTDLGVVTSHFNPCGFKVRTENFERCVAPIREADIPLVVVEACFEGGARLPASHRTLQVAAKDVMWHKERLLDLGTGWLPSHCTKVAWVDADVLFENGDWAVETSALLERAVVAQPFARAVRMSRGCLEPREGDDTFESFAAMFVNKPETLADGKFELHGHTGFAWAAQRDVMAQHGFYDACIAGSGDHLMAHAFAGDAESRCIARIAGTGGPHRAHFRRWSRKIHADVGARLAFTPGRVFHLWHGTIANRRYAQRNRELYQMGFDPRTDLRISHAGCWEWASDKPELHAWARRYFEDRREDEEA
jgi:hypothetical protein